MEASYLKAYTSGSGVDFLYLCVRVFVGCGDICVEKSLLTSMEFAQVPEVDTAVRSLTVMWNGSLMATDHDQFRATS